MEAFEETDKMLRLLVEHAAIGKINLPERYGISALVTQAMGRLKRWSFQQWSRNSCKLEIWGRSRYQL